MKRANRLMLIIGVALAALAFVAVLAFGGLGAGNKSASDPNVPVVVAASDLALGSQVTAAQLTTTTKPQSQATGTYQDPNAVVGKVVRQAVAKGAVLTTEDFSSSVTVPDLVQSLAPGLRAIAIPLDSTNSVAGLIQAGDRVDVLLSMEDLDGLNPVVVPNPASPGTNGAVPDPYISIDDMLNNTTVKVVLQNVQVVAAIASAPTTDGNGNSNSNSQASPAPAMVALLAVTPQQAEVVRFAQLDGNISLVLRAPADANAPAVDTTGITLRELVDQYGVLPPAPVSPVTP